jgi:hypothetical protein
MDPYLEGIHWTGFHATLGVEIVRQLAPRLRPRYVALPVERTQQGSGVRGQRSEIFDHYNVLSEQQTESSVLLTSIAIPTAIPHLSIEVRDTAERRLVTAIEILSPTNKRGEGREEYLTKRQRLLLQQGSGIRGQG